MSNAANSPVGLTEQLRKYIEGKAVYERLFPRFILALGDAAQRRLSPAYGLVPMKPGPVSVRWYLDTFTKEKEPFNFDWICFGFGDSPVNEKHVGAVFDLNGWPFSVVTGMHCSQGIFEAMPEALMSSAAYYGLEYKVTPTEHQFNNARRTLNLENLDGEMNAIVDRISDLYIIYDRIFMNDRR